MSCRDKSQKIVVLATGAVVGISATAIVLSQQGGASSVQSALRDGARNAAINPETSGWVQIAKCRTCGD
jgi:hypothetical protein